MLSTRLLSATALMSTLAILPAAAHAQAGTQPNQTSPAAQCTANPQSCQQGPSTADQSAGTGSPLATDGNQTPQAAAGEGADVLVTGSRIARPNLDSAVPVTAITAADLTDSGNVSLGDELNQLPALRATYSQANSTRNIGTAGINQLDLRGLGTDRTLVLVNGRRHVSAIPGSYIVDVNTIPNALLQSVEVVTGGTSAVYGSDAIAGVVNFKLKTDFTGIEARVQSGISSRNDRGSFTASLVAGKNFADDRGNIAASIEYARQESVLFSDRNAQTGAYTGVPGFFNVQANARQVTPGVGAAIAEPPGGDGIFDTRYFSAFPGSTFGNLSLSGAVQTTCPSATGTALNAAQRSAVCTGGVSPVNGGAFTNVYVFSQDGRTLVRDNPALDLRPQGGGVFGGLTATGAEGSMLLPGLQRVNSNLLFNFEFSPALRLYAEGKYVHVSNDQTSTQPTFVNSTLSPTFFLDNPFLTAQARSTIQTILGTTSTTGAFTFFRFNNDLGTRAENHLRDTYRGVVGLRGDISDAGNVNYDLSVNYGRTNTYYKTGGNVDVVKFNAAANAAPGPNGPACRVNVDTNPNNDLPGCVPINLFGQYQASQAALNYVLYTSQRRQWATEFDVVGSIAGDSSMLFELPAGPVGFAAGFEYRKEDAFSDYDDFTQGTNAVTGQANTFLNAIGAFNPKAVTIKEAFGELRVPLLKDTFIRELSLEGAGRYSKYSNVKDGVWAYNVGAVFAPVRDLRFRVGYAKSVRAPNLGDLYAGQAQTFANGFVDPCSQGTPINANPNRVRNCAAAGIPTTITFVNDQGATVTQPWVNTASSGIVGFNGGNPNLTPEIGKSLTAGVIFEPRFLPGLALSIDYYRIKVENVISSLGGQALINQCYDDPVGITNQYCALISRRTSTNAVVNGTFTGQQNRSLTNVANNARDFVGVPLGSSFNNAPFNYALLKTSGIDADLSYNHLFPNGVRISYRGLLSWLQKREQFTFLNAPSQSTRIQGTLGDPVWRGRFSANIDYKGVDFGYDLNYIGRMAVGAWELQHTHQGRGPTNLDAFPISEYAPQLTHDFQLGFRVNSKFRGYVGVDNALDTLPPYGLTGTGAGGGIYGVVGRFMYAGVNLRY